MRKNLIGANRRHSLSRISFFKFSKLNSSKRAADPSQMFVYIAAIVIVGFVFLYGFKAVSTFLKSSQDIELAKFVKDFQAKASSVGTDFGSVQFVTISIPSKFSRVCVIDPYVPPPSDSYPQNGNLNCSQSELSSEHNQLTQEVCDNWDEMYQDSISAVGKTIQPKNVFFVDQDGKVGYSDYIPDIALADSSGFVCTKDGKLRLEGEARVARVSLDESS